MVCQLRDILEMSRTLVERMIARRGEFTDREAVLTWIEEQKRGSHADCSLTD